MKISTTVIAAALGLLATAALRAADAGKTGQIDVIFDHPENYTDVKDRVDPTDEGRDEILDAIRGCIVDEAGKYLPAGSHLTVIFTDIDLAGDFEPWRGPQYDNIRVVKPIYPPAFKFVYKATDATGKVLKEGKESIRDLNFETRGTLDRTDPLRIEKDILTDWIRNNLRGIR